MSEKTSGYFLLIVGILIMIFAASQIIMVFTDRAKPMQLFQADENSTSSPNSFNPQELLKQFQNQDSSQSPFQTQMPSIQLINTNALNKILNLTVYYLIMQFLLGFGFKLASLGIQLLRPIVVEMKHKNFEQIKDETHIN